jgi:hypothetical protein
MAETTFFTIPILPLAPNSSMLRGDILEDWGRVVRKEWVKGA